MTSTQTPREQYAAAAHAPLVETPPPAVWRHRHLLDLDAVSPEEIATVLRSAQAMKGMLGREVKKAPTLRGRTIVTLFSEPSTRTRVSFETAGKLLSADVINLSSDGSSTEKGESLVDTVLTLQAAAADVLVMRHSHSGAPYLAAKTLERTAVINAGDGAHAHPTQALLDLFTIQERLGSLEGKRVAIVGDISHSRVARSDLWGLCKMGATPVLCGPPTLMPWDLLKRRADEGHPFAAVEVETDIDRAMRGSRRRHASAPSKGAADGGPLAQRTRVRTALAGGPGPALAQLPAGNRHAPRPDERGGGDQPGRGPRRSFCGGGAGDQRPRRPHGAAAHARRAPRRRP